MDSSGWERIQELFNRALDMGSGERENLLRNIRQDDAEAYEEVLTLLRADDRNSEFTDGLGIPELVAGIGPQFEGRTVGPYIVESEIGRGAMGVVYKATDSRLDRHVALKFLAGSHAATNEARIRFYAEAKAVSRLDHPNICTIFDIGETDEGALYIAMAHYDGSTLDAYLAESALPLRDALHWLEQIAAGLHFAHGKGVVHRDVKAANIFLTKCKQVKILDFGVAKLHGVDITGPGLRMGTVSYMSPEQLLGETIDRRTDIWSLGVVLYDLLASRKPFRGDSSGEVASEILRADVTPVTAQEKWLPPIVDRIIARCLSRDVKSRYSDLGEFLDDFKNFQNLVAADPKLSSHLVGRADDASRNETEFTHFSELETRQITVVSCRLQFAETESQATREQSAELSLLLQRQCESYALSEGISFVHGVDCITTLCFGYPRSEEDNSARALRAAIALQAHLLDSDQSETKAQHGEYTVTFGIHTGDAIVDSTGTANSGFIHRLQGDVCAVADEIQAFADDGDIVVSQRTAGILQDKRNLTLVGNMPVTGSADNISVHRFSDKTSDIDRPSELEFDIDRKLIGRASERAILSDSWNSVVEGEGKILAFCGEAGIGKSRIMRLAFNDLKNCSANSILILGCSAYYEHSFLYPFKEWLRNELAEIASRRSQEISTDTLSEFLEQHEQDDQRAHYFLAKLLNIDQDDSASENREYQMTTPEMRHDYTLQAIVDAIACKAALQPVLIVIEDLHWADVSSVEVIQRLVDQGPDSRFLLLLSFRPEFSAEWLGRSHILKLTIGKLDRKQSEALARDRFGELDIPADLIRKIADKSDGVPLFIEELCSMLRDSNRLDRDSVVGELTIPDTLRDSLTARLDRRMEYKPIAQLASVLGRKFEYQMISKTWTGDSRVLNTGLDYLVESELLFQTGLVPNATFLFKHSLIQDAAYSSLVGSTRARYHKLVADVIERFFPDDVNRHPEVLATHFSNALLPERAIPYWLAAAISTLQQSALVNAISHARQGLAALDAIPDGEERLRLELRLLMTLGPALMAYHSWSLPEVRDSYERARTICAELGNVPELFPVLYGLYTYHCVVGNHEEGRSLNRLSLQVANTSKDDGLLLEANMLKGMTHFFFGEFSSAIKSLEHCSSRYDLEQHGDHCYLYGQDPGMVTCSYLALTLAISGRSEQSIDVSEKSLVHTRALNHPFSLAYGLTFAAWLHLFLDNIDLGHSLAEEAQELCRNQHIEIMLGMSRVLIGRSKYARKQYEQAAIDIGDGLKQFELLGAGVLMPFWHGYLSQAELGRGKIDSALNAVNRGFDWAARTNEQWSTAELHRIKANVLWQNGSSNNAADVEITKAIALAKTQGAQTFENRALRDNITYNAANKKDFHRL